MPDEPIIPEDWTDAEKWAWDEIHAGNFADFNIRYNNELDPKKPDGWDDKKKDRRLSAAFLVTILTNKTFKRATPYQGVRVRGACFEQVIDLEHARLEHQLWLEKCWFKENLNFDDLLVDGLLVLMGSRIGGIVELKLGRFGSSLLLGGIRAEKDITLAGTEIGGQLDLKSCTFDGNLDLSGADVRLGLFMGMKAAFQKVVLKGAKIGGELSMDGSTFRGELNMNGIKIRQSLFMHGKATFQRVNLAAAKIGGQLATEGSTFNGKLQMNGIEIGDSLFMRKKSSFQEVDLTGARIGRHLSTISSTFHGKLIMNGSVVEGSLLMRGGCAFQEIDLTCAHIGGLLSLNGSTVHDELSFDSIVIGRDFYARGTLFPIGKTIDLFFAEIGAGVDLSGATISAIDLTGTTIAGELRLGLAVGQYPTNWVGESKMVLRNTTVGAIQDADSNYEIVSWPMTLELAGFSCRHLGGFGAEGPADMASRPSEWFIKWLERDKTSSPQPYETIANLLNASGHPSKANDILYVGRERARAIARESAKENPREWWRWLGMSILKLTIGYGLGARYFRIAGAVLFFTLIGVGMLWSQVSHSEREFFTLFWASFDHLLPFIELDKLHTQIFEHEVRSDFVRGYLYIHQLMGFVLPTFLIAGLAGLTQKSR